MVRKRITMEVVAKKANVSQSTVSHVINKTAPISPAVEKKVNEVIKELNYIPNAAARNLKRNKTNIIGLVIPDVSNGYYTEIIENTETILRENGYITFLCNTLYNTEFEKVYIENLVQQNVAGIIIGYGLINRNLYQYLLDFGVPFVVMDDTEIVENSKILCVKINNTNGSLLAVEHLYNIKSKKICFASEALFNSTSKARYDGFYAAAKQYGYTDHCIVEYISNVQGNRLEIGYNIGAQIYLDGTIDGIFANTDNIAIGITQRLREYNVSIPNDIAIIGYDGISLSALVTPTLTTVVQPHKEMARRGLQMLIKRINGGELENATIELEPTLIIRESTMKKKLFQG